MCVFILINWYNLQRVELSTLIMAVRIMDMLKFTFKYVFHPNLNPTTNNKNNNFKASSLYCVFCLAGCCCNSCRFLVRSLVGNIPYLTCSLEHKSTYRQHICSHMIVFITAACVCVWKCCVGEIVAQGSQLVFFA